MSYYDDDIYVPKKSSVAKWIAVIILLCIAIPIAAFGIRWVTAPAKGKLDAREQINSGSYRIAAYDHFFDSCASVQTLKTQLVAQRTQLKGAKGDEADRIKANIAGVTGILAEAVNTYNTDAAKSYTIGQFKSSSLPYQLSMKGETVCVI